jgi:hypothetical protein
VVILDIAAYLDIQDTVENLAIQDILEFLDTLDTPVQAYQDIRDIPALQLQGIQDTAVFQEQD